MTALCVRQAVQGSRQVCAGAEGQLLLLLPWRPRDAALVLALRRRQASATQMALLLRGLPAQRHRSASLTEEEPHPERHRSSTSRCFLKMLPWSGFCVPMGSRSSRWRAAHRPPPSTTLRRAVSEDRGGTRARQGPGLRACTHLLLHPMQDSSTIRHSCEQLLTLTIRATGDRLVDCPRPARHSALETFTIRVTPCPCRRTTSRGSRRGRPRRPRRRRCLRSRRSRGRSCSRWRTRTCRPLGCSPRCTSDRRLARRRTSS